jgi:hypothetical protein
VVRDGGVPVITRQCNFGAPGGLGKKTFAVYAYKSYGIRLGKTTEEAEAKAAELIQQYKSTWLEMPEYFRRVNSWARPTGKTFKDEKGREKKETFYNIIQPWSGRLRAKATYCAAANSPFQGLGSDVAKVALWYVFKACYGFSELGANDPLIGCHMVNFVHDQIILEAPAAKAHAAGYRLAELMNRAGHEVMPDTRMIAEPTLANQWSKKAVTWYATASGEPALSAKTEGVQFDDEGRPVLIPWDVHKACDMEIVKWRAMNDVARGKALDHEGPSVTFSSESVQRYLKKTDWPNWVAKDAMLRAGLTPPLPDVEELALAA